MADNLKNRYIEARYLLHELVSVSRGAKYNQDMVDLVLSCPKVDAVPIQFLKDLKREWTAKGYLRMADTLDAMMWKYLDEYDLDGDLWNV